MEATKPTTSTARYAAETSGGFEGIDWSGEFELPLAADGSVDEAAIPELLIGLLPNIERNFSYAHVQTIAVSWKDANGKEERRTFARVNENGERVFRRLHSHGPNIYVEYENGRYREVNTATGEVFGPEQGYHKGRWGTFVSQDGSRDVPSEKAASHALGKILRGKS